MTDSTLPLLQGMKGQRVALLGCGDIGSLLAQQLQASGAEVTAFRRTVSALPDDLPAVACDFSIPESLAALSQQHFDYAVVTLTPSRTEPDRAAAYQQGYVNNLKHILEALSLVSLKKLIWVSSTSVYAQDDESWIDETSETQPQRATGRILLEAESQIRQLGDKGCIVRFSGIYRGKTYRMIEKLKAGALPAQIDRDYYSNRIHVNDCAGVLGFLLQQNSLGAAIDHVYIATDSSPVKYTDLVDWLAEAMQLPLNREEVGRKPDVGSKRLSNARIRAAGYQFQFPTYKEGLRTFLPDV